MGGAWRSISVALRADASGYLGPISAASAATRKLGDEADRSTKKAGGGWTSLSKLVKVGVAGMVLAVGAFIGASISAASKFETQMSAIGAVSGATGVQMDQLRAKALQLGADTSFSASEAAMAMEELVKAGVPVEGVLNGAADAAVALAAAGGVALPVAAEIAANAMNQFGLDAAELPHIADLIAGAANASAIDVEDFGMSMAQAGAVAQLTGLSFDDLAVAVTAMGNAGIKGSDAGTSLKTFLMRLVPSTEKARAEMQSLGIITEDGANRFFNASGEMKSYAEVSEVLKGSLSGMNREQQLMTLNTLFGSDAIRAAAVSMNLGAEGAEKLNDELGKSSAAEIAATRMDNLEGAIENFKGSVETAMILVGSKFTPYLKDAALAGAGLVSSLTSGDIDGTFLAPLVDAASMLAPAWQDLQSIGADVVAILGSVADVAGPAGAALAAIAAGATIIGLNAIASALETITGTLADNEGAVKVVTAALITLGAVRVFATLAGYALGFTRSIVGIGQAFTRTNIAQNLGLIGSGAKDVVRNLGAVPDATNRMSSGVQAGFGKIKTGISGIGASFLSALSPATIAFGGLTVATLLYADNQQKLAAATAASKARIEELTSAVKDGQQSLEDAFDAQLLTTWSKEADKLSGFGEIDLGVDSFTEFRDIVTLSEADYQSWLDSVADTSGYDKTSFAMDLATGAIRGAREEYAAASTEIDRYRSGQAELEGSTGAAAAEQAAQTIVTEGQAEQFKQLAADVDAARSAIEEFYGSTTSMIESEIALKDSIESVSETIRGNVAEFGAAGAALDTSSEAGRRNVESLIAAKDAAIEYGIAVFNQTGSADAAAVAVQHYADGLARSATQAGASETEVKNMLATMGLTPEQITTQFATLGIPQAEAALRNVSRPRRSEIVAVASGIPGIGAALDALTRTRRAQVNVAMNLVQNSTGLSTGQIFGKRWGGIQQYANGGVNNITAAGVYSGDLIRFAEPETVKEAYIPFRGNVNRSLSVLGETASWFGMDVVPKAKMSFARGGVYGTTMVPGGYTSSSAAGRGGISVSMPVSVKVMANGDEGVARIVHRELVPAIAAKADLVMKTLKRWDETR